MCEAKKLLVPGLPEEEVFRRAAYFARGAGVAGRLLGFYLLEIQRRRLYRSRGYNDVVQYAERVLDLKPREIRELVQGAQKSE